MNEKLRKAILLASLGAVILWASFNMGKDAVDQSGRYDLATIQSLTPALSSNSIQLGVVIDTNRLAQAAWGPDPLRPMKRFKGRIAPVLSWKLTGIMFNTAQPMAYINQKVVKIGDMIDKARVIKIEKHTVILKYSNELITLTVSKG